MRIPNCDCGLTGGCENCLQSKWDVLIDEPIPRLPLRKQIITFAPPKGYQLVPDGSLVVPPDSWQRKYAEGDLQHWARKMGRPDNLGFYITGPDNE